MTKPRRKHTKPVSLLRGHERFSRIMRTYADNVIKPRLLRAVKRGRGDNPCFIP